MQNNNSIPYYQVDAFTNEPYGGNPAGVCPLTEWLPDSVLQNIAIENNISETAFFVAENDGYRLRWFTPGCEVDLCGHATLAAAWVLVNRLGFEGEEIKFYTRSGLLTITKEADGFLMDFPAFKPVVYDVPDTLFDALGCKRSDAIGTWKAPDLIVMFKSVETIENLKPDMSKLVKIDARGVVCTALDHDEDNRRDVYSRWFGPQVGVNEDPVTGSAYTWIVPLWAGITNKTLLFCEQGGERRGNLRCELVGDRLEIFGLARLVIEGKFYQ